ncbi:MAG: 3-isopropylmalate dehydratase large subunit, partial [Candidatus Brockarchaeota archaeon]|nr:3-isopropylmalate dehydratase large subunit [Candidatus Brockarchaeota archaeon]
DLLLANDVTAPMAIEELGRAGIEKVFDPSKVVLVADHMVPSKDILAAELCKKVREFARRHGIAFYECGRGGIEHALLPEEGLVLPGMFVVGADSHTCTYGALGCFATGVGSTDFAAALALGELWFKVPQSMKLSFNGKLGKALMGKDLILLAISSIGVDGAAYRALEMGGSAVDGLSIDGRLSMCNMAIEAGAKSGIMAPDEKTVEYVESRTGKPFRIYRSGPDSEYADSVEFEVSKIEPQVALPHSPGNAKPVSEVEGTEVDQVVIGSCTNGRMEDMRAAAKIFAGRSVHPRVRCIVIPATQKIYLQALREGLVEAFVKANAAVSTPTCGPCLGMHMGVLGSGEVALSTTNRNFVGRMGHKSSKVYLASPLTAAATAVEGKIADPRRYL